MANPFNYIAIILAAVIITSGCVGVLAPELTTWYPDVDIPANPELPVLDTLDYQGSLNTTEYTFDETHNITFVETATLYSDFFPDKQVITYFSNNPLDTNTYFMIQRWGEMLILPGWVTQPLFYDGINLAGNTISTTQIILLANEAQTVTTINIDKGNTEFEAWLDITPLDGYITLGDSMNTGLGLKFRIYGYAYMEPDWMDQASAYLSFIGGIIWYFLSYVVFMVAMLGVAFQFVGIVPAVATAISGVIIIVFVGSLLMFIRGTKE